MAIRSGKLASGASPGPGQQTQLGNNVPANTTWLVKSVVIFNNGVGTGITIVELDDAGVGRCVLLAETIAVGATRIVQGTFAIPPGGSIQVTWQGNSMWAYVTGTVLPGTI